MEQDQIEIGDEVLLLDFADKPIKSVTVTGKTKYYISYEVFSFIHGKYEMWSSKSSVEKITRP